MLLDFAIWLQNTGLMRALRESDHGYEILLSLHVSFIALFGASIALTNTRLLGWALTQDSIADVVDQLRWPKRVGFLCVATCGFLLFGMKAEEYYLNIFFRIKILLFLTIAVHAAVFRPRVYNTPAELEGTAGTPARAKIAALLAMLLWLGVVCAGRGIGYIHPPPFSHHFTWLRSAPGSRDERNRVGVVWSDSISNLSNRTIMKGRLPC
jgi:hypothetical protein